MQPSRSGDVEERVEHFNRLVSQASPEVLDRFHQKLDVSWIYHDSALEGVVYSQEELAAAVDNQVVSDSTLLPAYDEIQQNKKAIDLVREMAEKRRKDLSLEHIKAIYTALVPEEGEGKGPPKYRKEMPVHRMYFHEIAAPEKISYKMRQLITWMNSADAKRSTHPVRLAAKAHHQLLHIYPFPRHSGKVARLLMNLMLLRQGYPPVIIHSTERQHYFEALRAEPNDVATLVHDSFRASVESAIRVLEMS